MPTYCYSAESGEIVEKFFRMGEAPFSFYAGSGCDRVTFTRDYKAERVGVPSTTGWPMTCCASGVNASQAGELREYLAKHSVPTEVTPGGDPTYTSKRHRDKALKVRSMHDRASFN